MRAEAIAGRQPDYPVFMAVAEKVGIDRRGNHGLQAPPGRRGHPGTRTRTQSGSAVRGRDRTSPSTRMVKAVDNDLPEIAKAYKAFREKYPEPGRQAVITRIEAHSYRCFP